MSRFQLDGDAADVIKRMHESQGSDRINMRRNLRHQLRRLLDEILLQISAYNGHTYVLLRFKTGRERGLDIDATSVGIQDRQPRDVTGDIVVSEEYVRYLEKMRRRRIREAQKAYPKKYSPKGPPSRPHKTKTN